MKEKWILRRSARRSVRRITQRMLALFLACFVFTATVYYDYQEAHATSIVIGGIVWTVGEAFALLMVAVGVSATTAVTYQNRDTIKAWGEEQIDSFCAWMAEADEVVWSAQQEVEEWALSVIEGGLTTSGDMWNKFKKWVKSLYFRDINGDYDPTENAYLLESVSEIVGVPFYVGMPSASFTVYYPTTYNELMSKYDSYVIMTKDSGSRGLRIAEVYAGISQIKISSNRGVYISFSAGCTPSVSDDIIKGAGLGTSNSYWQDAYTGVYVSSNLVFEFDSSYGLEPVYTGVDPLPSEENKYALDSTVANALETADDFDLINPGAAASDVVNINWGNLDLDKLPEILSDLSTGALALDDVLTQLGIALVDAQTGDVISGDADPNIDIDDNGFPWLPNIIEWLKKIWNAILAIPASIASAIENVVVGQDDGNYKISDIVTDKFPFCIPFDLIHCFQVVQATPISPVWKIPFVIDNQYIQYSHEITIDFTDWERPVVVIRYFILLIYIAGLVYATRYVIKG